jgi:cell division protein FtsL
MKDPIKITQEELQSTADLQQKFQQSVMEFGNLYIEKMTVETSIKTLTEKENKLQEEWKNLQVKENELIQGFYKKYGDGSLNLAKGLFIPNESK